MLLVVVFVVPAWKWLPYVVFAISPTVGNLHKPSDSLRLLSAKLLDVRFLSDVVAESINRPVDRDISASFESLVKRPMYARIDSFGFW
jgi:hypothetical protein